MDQKVCLAGHTCSTEISGNDVRNVGAPIRIAPQLKDVRVTPDFLRTVAAEFQDSNIGVATCPYRAVPGASLWSRLETTGMNTDFWGSALVARMLEGMRFAVGPTIVARRRVLRAQRRR